MSLLDRASSLVKINGQILEYHDVEKPIPIILYHIYHSSGIHETEARELFHKLKSCFDDAGIPFSLTFGSLLGAVRNGTVIPGDGDMDVYTWEEEKLRAHLIDFYSKGLKVIRILPGSLYSFITDSDIMDFKCYIDVYIYAELRGFPSILWRRSCIGITGCETPRELFTGYREIEFLGEKVLCPENPEKLLEFWYGSDWRIPQSKKGTYRVKSAQRAHDIINSIKRKFRLIYKCFKFIFNKDYRQQLLLRKEKYGAYSYKKAYQRKN